MDMVDRRPLAFWDSRMHRLVVGRRRRTVCRQSGVDFVTSPSSVDSRPCLDVSTALRLSVHDHRRLIHYRSILPYDVWADYYPPPAPPGLRDSDVRLSARSTQRVLRLAVRAYRIGH